MTVANATQTLIRRIINGPHIANAYLLVGPAITFRRHAASWMAQAIHCKTPDQRPCGSCNSCRSYLNQTNVNAIQVSNDTKLNIDAIRTLQEMVKYGPSQNLVMTVEIPNADTMTEAVSNAFLKTLEEPVSGVIFLLCASSEYAVLPTIKSRCQLIHCAVPTPDQIDAAIENMDTPIPADWRGAQALVIDALDTGLKLPEKIPSIFDVLRTPADLRMGLAIQLYAHKESLQLILRRWLYELTSEVAKNPIQFTDSGLQKRIDLLVENINNLRYNLNSRLHIDSLLLSL